MSCFAKTSKVIRQVYVEMWKALGEQFNRWRATGGSLAVGWGPLMYTCVSQQRLQGAACRHLKTVSIDLK